MNASNKASEAVRESHAAVEYRITLQHPLELEDAPDFVSWPPRVPIDRMLAACEAELRRRAAAGLPIPRHTPVDAEFVL